MGVTSIRLNEEDKKILEYLKKHYHCDTSTLFKKSLRELFETIKDQEIIEEFEEREKAGQTKFLTIDTIIQ